ncbi:MAG: hypothetical protein US86_C0010G0001 [Candidatus Daviesbacteria bacterium GW2011_GWA2_38_24]|uniref:Uncharacterized protein n=1 Tax=Candidatus Daviesbacteria bacterium GW2011_GWA2_38_24 TaxID=1618422 RepID=A0A0G0JR00_9BACT|nr:MAG: hypothetical protein US86_C0010G0001 [Candidatus Daviesbacteria bacterium GW2011_GWA2_38_24]OGE23232.1 MAG: hypothetical protein A2688_00710 [Candidatus Daviesbacteria bacterium RIFCSPHIGHO2_01_FULL_38_8]
MPRNKVLISFAILTILIPVVLFFVSKNFSLKKPATVTPSPTSRALSLEEQINNCSITKEGNPLVNDVQVFKTGEKEAMVGTFRANINKVYPDSTKLSPSIELVSPRGDQTHTFRVTEEKGLVYDAVNQKDLKLTDLKPGLTVAASFNCFPDQNNLFKITQISVTSEIK